MTTIKCVLYNCKYNKNGVCTKKRIHLIHGRCADFRLSYEEFKGLKGRVICTYTACPYNVYNTCTKKEIIVKKDGCVMDYE